MDGLSWFALAIIFFVILTLTYGIVAIHDIPYKIAKARNHPHAQAIHTGGWVSLFTLHAIWPLLWIWATAYDPSQGYSGSDNRAESPAEKKREVKRLKARIAELESEIKT
ncbi:Inner membrane protein YiaW [Rubripirellula lacrimiformis]|uniref:Inner membrane protein YiaW n=1 Tax=Rubripirellula lacrimiformis TaxID=1930273 RepID=A0A517NFR6_9BACT|nr:DUF3302 domain-containing protein [Rubripirellula lacrimiformis]QDT05979.1 Inner membrane protein YiaW [Rubripirellula lacrimiformis]